MDISLDKSILEQEIFSRSKIPYSNRITLQGAIRLISIVGKTIMRTVSNNTPIFKRKNAIQSILIGTADR